MNKELEALRRLGELLGDLEIAEDTMLPKVVLSGNRAVNYKIVEQALKRLESIDNANPSEALELLDKSKNMMIENNGDFITFDCLRIYSVCKQALLKAQEQEKILKVIKEKGVDVGYLKTCKSLEEYNSNCWDDEEDFNKKITQEEFDLLKRYFNDNR